MPINLGCTWNASCVEQGFAYTAAALTALGGNVGLSPVVNSEELDAFPWSL